MKTTVVNSKPSESKSLFTSRREQRLWLWALIVMVAIYSTLGFAGTLAELLPFRELLDDTFVIAFFVLVAAILGCALMQRPRLRELWVALGVTAVYGMSVLRIGIPEERTHLFEYGLVAVLIYEALSERVRNGRHVPIPAILTIIATALLGWLDETIQAQLPNRVYDLRDVGFNALAGLMSVSASVALARARDSAYGSNRTVIRSPRS